MAPGTANISTFIENSFVSAARRYYDCRRIVEFSRCQTDEPMDAKQIVAALGALGQDTRLEVFRALVQRGPDGLAAGAIAQA
jgi:hypothetical protein